MKKLAFLTAVFILLSGLAAANPQISVQLMSTEPSPLQIGEYADVRFKVTNNGSDTKNVTVEFLESYPFSVDSDNQKRWRIVDFEEGDSYEFRVQTRVDSGALQGEEKIEIKASEGAGSRTFELPVQLKADDKGLVVQKVVFPEKVAPGTTKQMTLKLENTANAYFRNVDVALDFSQLPVVASGTSTQRVGSIAPGAQKEVVYKLHVDESAENGVYSLPVTLDYENEAGSTITKSLSTGIVVGGKPRLETALNDDGDLKAGSSGTVTFRFVNRGEGTAKFVKVEVLEGENYQILSGESVYLGDMNPDDYQTAEAEIYAGEGTDSIEVPVKLTYQENGLEKSDTSNVTVNILTTEELQKYGTSSSNYLVPAVLLLVLGAAGVYYWRRKRR
ncbi:MAG: COG1361 S-layer family protein [Candidatus Nanohaloarchaea archaeon]